MTSFKKAAARGFTTVELLIVVVVIVVLGGLILLTYNGIQQKNRDTERKDDINTVYGQLESYQAQNGKYPALANVNDSTWRSANMKNLDPAKLADPSHPNSQKLVSLPTVGAYAYTTSPAHCDNGAGGDCTSYTLTATLEGGGTYAKQSLN